jgi:hypothetical protein
MANDLASGVAGGPQNLGGSSAQNPGFGGFAQAVLNLNDLSKINQLNGQLGNWEMYWEFHAENCKKFHTEFHWDCM